MPLRIRLYNNDTAFPYALSVLGMIQASRLCWGFPVLCNQLFESWNVSTILMDITVADRPGGQMALVAVARPLFFFFKARCNKIIKTAAAANYAIETP